MTGEHGPAARGQQLRQPEGAADGLAPAGARQEQGGRAGQVSDGNVNPTYAYGCHFQLMVRCKIMT